MAKWKVEEKNQVAYVTVQLENEMVRTEAGAMRYIRGSIEMESKAPSIGGLFKAALSGEKIFRPTYTGTGLLVLEPSLGCYFTLEMNNGSYVLDRGAYWASDGSVEVSAKANKLMAGLLSGEGMIQTTVKGTGTVIVASEGPVEILELQNEKLVIDGSFAVARSESLDFSVQKSSKSLIGSMTSGEGLVSVNFLFPGESSSFGSGFKNPYGPSQNRHYHYSP